jgi:hypothetical protein
MAALDAYHPQPRQMDNGVFWRMVTALAIYAETLTNISVQIPYEALRLPLSTNNLLILLALPTGFEPVYWP